MANASIGPIERQEETLSGTCPYCLARIDVNFDIKGRPYWRCGRCDLRTFGTRAALSSLRGDGWIWSGERPPVALQARLRQLSENIGGR